MQISILQNKYRQITRNSILKTRLYTKVFKSLDPSLANLTIKVEMFKALKKVFSLTCPFYTNIIIILAVQLFAVTTTSFLDVFEILNFCENRVKNTSVNIIGIN